MTWGHMIKPWSLVGGVEVETLRVNGIKDSLFILDGLGQGMIHVLLDGMETFFVFFCLPPSIWVRSRDWYFRIFLF